MTTRAGTPYGKNFVEKSNFNNRKRSYNNKRNGLVPDNVDTVGVVTRTMLEKLTKAQLIDKLLAHMYTYNIEQTVSNGKNVSSSSTAADQTNNTTTFRCSRVTFSGVLIASVIPHVIKFLSGQSIHRLKCVSRDVHKFVDPFTSANFHRYYQVSPFKQYFNSLCSSTASLIEVKLDTAIYSSLPETLLQLCRCDYLRSFKLWYRGFFDHVVPGYTVDPLDQKNVLQLLAEKCSSTLTELRVGLQSREFFRSNLLPRDLINLQNLTSLEISMGDPREVLDVVAKLGKLRRFNWVSNSNYGIDYNPIDSVNYILRSDSLQHVELGLGKGKVLAGINCPNLRTMEMMMTSFYGTGFMEFECLECYSGFSCLFNDYERAIVCADTDADATDVTNYVSTDAGNTPLEDVTDDKHAFYGWHFIKINPTEVHGYVRWIKVHTKIHWPTDCVIKDGNGRFGYESRV